MRTLHSRSGTLNNFASCIFVTFLLVTVSHYYINWNAVTILFIYIQKITNITLSGVFKV
jgi:hypothetical protein